MGFFGSLTGKDQARDLKSGYKESTGMLKSGYEEGQTQYSNALRTIDGNVGKGAADQTAYRNALGLNGATARRGQQDIYNSDPMFNALADQQNKQIFSRYNAGGMGDSGASRLALGRAGLDRYDNYLSRLGQLGQQGQQADQTWGMAKAGLQKDQGDFAYGHAQQLAGQRTGLGNAMAQNRSVGVNNILGGLSSLGGMAISGFAPGAGGASAFGNMSKMFSGGK